MAAVDSSGVVLFQSLSVKNYARWAQRMALKLGSKGLMGVVLGTEEDKGGNDEQALITPSHPPVPRPPPTQSLPLLTPYRSRAHPSAHSPW